MDARHIPMVWGLGHGWDAHRITLPRSLLVTRNAYEETERTRRLGRASSGHRSVWNLTEAG